MPVTAPTAPSTPAASTPAAPPKTESPQVKSDDLHALSDEFKELDALDDDAPKPAPQRKVEAPPAAPKKEEATADEEIDEPEAKPDDEVEKPEAPAKEEKPVEEKKPVKAADLRAAYDGLKKKVKGEYEPKIAKLETRIKELESKPAGEEEIKLALSKLEAAEKRRAELEDEIRFVNYQKSSEFVEKYDKPYKEAWSKAIADLDELTVENEDGTTRKATAGDLVQLANMPLGEARKLAKTLFGEATEDVMAHRRNIIELSNAQKKAIEDAQKNGAEREKVKSLEFKAKQEKAIAQWQETNTALAQRYPKWFAPEEGDEEGNALLTKGFSYVDKMFAPTQENPMPTDPAEVIKLHAIVRNKAANHDRLALKLKKSATRIAELEKALKAYEKSEPPAGKAGASNKGTGAMSLNDEIDAEIDAIDRA